MGFVLPPPPPHLRRNVAPEFVEVGGKDDWQDTLSKWFLGIMLVALVVVFVAAVAWALRN